MSGGTRSSVVRSIRTLFGAGSVAGMTDRELLDRSLDRDRDAAEAAFAAIVKLHGPMVWGVCRGILSEPHDAEDAFQAVFLILVRKAGSVRRRDTLGPWLHGVARRVAVRARAEAARRRRREGTGVDEMTAIPTPDPSRKEDADILHREIDRLPEKYRSVIVLCHLEGRTQADAARLLGCPIGTIGVRVARARDLLRDRLIRRGLALPAALAGATLVPETASATVPAALAAATVKVAMGVAAGKSLAAAEISAAVFQLSRGVLRTMTISKLTIAASCVLTAGALSTGLGWVAMGDGPAKAEEREKPSSPAPAPVPALTKQEIATARLKGMNQLRRIGLAMNQYAASGKDGDRFPPSATRKDDRPLLSWRVAILPYLGEAEAALYRKFKLDEPWDSPHNKALLEEMPAVYAPVVDREAPKSSTYYQVLEGPGSLFEAGKGRSLATIVDGASLTLLVVEAATPVPWTKPEDLAFEKDRPPPKLGGQFDKGFLASFVDASVHFFNREMNPESLRAIITRNGRETFDTFDLNSPDPDDPPEFGLQ